MLNSNPRSAGFSPAFQSHFRQSTSEIAVSAQLEPAAASGDVVAVRFSTGLAPHEPRGDRHESGAGDSAMAMLVLSVVFLLAVALVILSNLRRGHSSPAVAALTPPLAPALNEPAPALGGDRPARLDSRVERD